MTGVFGETLTDLLQPWPLKIVIDYVVGSKQMPSWLAHWFDSTVGTDKLVVLNVAAVSVFLIAVAGAVSSYIQSVTMTSVGQWVMHDLRSTLYNHIQRLSLSFHDQSQRGDLITPVTSHIDAVQGCFASSLMNAV